ncbi:hypothetical protein OC846_002161 [Tilletia horrida]|uniref:Nucleoporin Nup133/Nup155-like N-terminal domain-containing protein n=1 Tax=Tilletia horrida TaxID=155126 RepID=A0AAN6GRW7_9BASI|nr:hypothetical protein OC846_002161 [Tilletia horrida]
MATTINGGGGSGGAVGAGGAGGDPFFRQLDGASSIVRQYLQEDIAHPDLSEHLSATTPGHYRLVLNEINTPVERKRIITIPDAVIEASTSANSHAAQGLFPEIERAWISIDNNLFLWDYLDGGPDAIEYHRHSDYIIQAVGLVKARKDVLVDSIKHVLILSTTASVTLLGLGFETAKAASSAAASSSEASSSASAAPRKELKIYGLDMVVPTQGVTMVDFAGTDSGRLFCRGREDDCIYEISYQASESWFKQKCTLTNLTAPTYSNLVPSFLQSKTREHLTTITIDRERSVLYALYKKTDIEVWNIPADQTKPPHKIARASDICRQATNICPSTNMLPAFDFSIEWMGAIPPSESRTLHLVAVTSKGVRLYFSHSRSFYRTTSSNANYPPVDCLDLRAVRPPPQPNSVEDVEERNLHAQHFQPQQFGGQQPQQALTSDIPPQHPATGAVRTAYYSHGVFLAASTLSKDHDNGVDNILYVARSPARASRTGASSVVGGTSAVTGTGTAAGTGGVGSLPQNLGFASELAETATDLIHRATTTVISEAPQAVLPGVSTTDSNGIRLSTFGLQLMLGPRQFLVFGNSGLVILSERRPIDVLRGMLESNQAFEQTIVPFFNRYGYPQCCAMLLAIAARNRQVSQASSSELAAGVSSSFISDDAVSSAWRLFFEFGGAPSYLAGLRTSQALSESNVRLSNRFEGLALYVARLLRPFWASPVTKKAPVAGGDPNRQDVAVNASVLVHAQSDLASLQQFLTANSQFFVLSTSHHQQTTGGGGGAVVSAMSQESEAYAWKVEHDRVESIRALISRTLEALSFVLLLIDYQFPTVVALLKPPVQTQLSQITFADLITSVGGRDLARALVEAVIDRQISSQVSIDSIADVLQQRCGSFCSAADVQLYKALELVRGAKEGAGGEGEKEELLKDGMKLLVRAAPHLPFEKLEAICADFRKLKYAKGAIELPLTCAAAWDPSDLANSIPPNASGAFLQNHPALPILEKRNACYSLVLEMLQDVDEALNQAEQLPESNTNRINELRKADELHRQAYDLALAQNDQLFHWRLYDWLLERGMTEQLLEVHSAYIEKYLNQEPSTVQKLHLLWQLYRRDGAYISAAHVLCALARLTDTEEINLAQRIEFYSIALALARSVREPQAAFTDAIESELDVARVQLEVLQNLQQRNAEEELLRDLDENLFNLTELYVNFANAFDLHEVKIMIFHVSGHRDAALVRATWQQIVNTAHDDPNFKDPQRFQSVSIKVSDIGKRFMPSEAACPISVLLEILETYAYEERDRQDIPVGWAPTTLHLAGANPVDIFDNLDALLSSRTEPWDTKQARVFLLSEVSTYLNFWLQDTLTNTRSGTGIAFDFPANRIDDAISAYLTATSALSSAVAKGEVDLSIERSLGTISTALKEVQDEIRLKF